MEQPNSDECKLAEAGFLARFRGFLIPPNETKTRDSLIPRWIPWDSSAGASPGGGLSLRAHAKCLSRLSVRARPRVDRSIYTIYKYQRMSTFTLRLDCMSAHAAYQVDHMTRPGTVSTGRRAAAAVPVTSVASIPSSACHASRLPPNVD